MDKNQAITRIQEQIDKIGSVRRKDPSFDKWRRDTEVLLRYIFGEGSRQVREFSNISYSPRAYNMGNPEPAFIQAFQTGINRAGAILQSMAAEITEFWAETTEEVDSVQNNKGPIFAIENLIKRFHVVARQLRDRHSGRPTLDVQDEYDIQDLLHSLLLIHFDDIRPEDWTPNYAGSNSRVDFLLKANSIIIEVKRASRKLGAKEIADQLIIDIERYKQHPDAKLLICFIYDPEGVVGNYAALEQDLSREDESFSVRVLVAPKGF